MIVVSDAGPLIHLARAEYLHLLRDFFGTIVIPPSVFDEVCERGEGQWGADEVRDATWVRQERPRDTAAILARAPDLDTGEADALALALELPASLLLIDELGGRRIARFMGVEVRGTLGLLAEGYRRGMVDDIDLAFRRLLERGTWIDDELLSRIRSELGV